MSSYLWRKLSEGEKKKIEQDAKELILKFGDMLEKLPKIEDAVVERDESVREESESNVCNDSFRDLMFANAPKVKDDCILGERGSWVK